ncbi:MAG TPA: biopolymer transporter ExbD [Candidatus Acidoferrum sp.]|nr:biopolymer transporter ExbD [Candidatus Acidoferrum sp.]
MDRQFAPAWSPSKAAAQREAKRRPVFYKNLNLWPFVGVVVALLFTFLANVPPFVHSVLPHLPTSIYATVQPRAEAEDAMKVLISRDGRVFFGEMQVNSEELPGFIDDALQNGAEKKVYLAVDSRSKFADTAAVVDQIGKAGIRDICFLTEKANPR